MTTVAFRLLFHLALPEGFGASELSGLDPWYFVRRRAAWALQLSVILGPSTRRATGKVGIVNMSGDGLLCLYDWIRKQQEAGLSCGKNYGHKEPQVPEVE